MSVPDPLLDMENDVLGANEMAGAIFMLVERMALAEKGSAELSAVLRCVDHLQSHTAAIVRDWKLATSQAAISRAA